MYLSSYITILTGKLLASKLDQVFYVLIRKFYSYIVVNNLWLALEWYNYTHAMVNGVHAMVSTPKCLMYLM